MTVEKLPRAVRTSTMKISDLELTVYHLDNGQRVIDAESMARFFECLERGEDVPPMKDVTP